FADQERDVLEGFVTDVLPADTPGGVDEKRSMQRETFKVVVSAKGLESRARDIGDERNRERVLLTRSRGGGGSGKFLRRIHADSQQPDSGFGKLADRGIERLELFDAVNAVVPEVKD